MGYYIEFIFNHEKINSFEAIVDRFKNEGAEVIVDDTIPTHISEKCLDLFHEDLSMPIVVFKRESKTLKGNWAHVRLSWATNQETFFNDLRCMLALAKSVGARLYDGQANMDIKEENLSDIYEEYRKGARWAINMVGTVSDKPSSR